MKTKIALTFFLCCCFGTTLAQSDKTWQIGIKASILQTNTRLVKQPKNSIFNLRGIGSDYGFQAGLWGYKSLSKWLMLENDLYYQQRRHRMLNPNNVELRKNIYDYIGLSSRVGVKYRGVYASFGPELNLLVNKDVKPWTEAPRAELGLNMRLGYQYRFLKIEAFYSHALTPYEQSIELREENVKTLFYGNNLGLGIGVSLHSFKKKK
ncbi:MAG: hypothetical protein ACK4GN_05115 [Runella sp.]